MKRIFASICLFAIAGCSQIPAEYKDLPDKVVYRTQGYYNAGVVAETAYDKLPLCPTQSPICSDTAIKKKLRKIDEAAYIAIKEAQVAVRTPSFAEGKVTTFVTSAEALTKAFTDIAATLPKEK